MNTPAFQSLMAVLRSSMVGSTLDSVSLAKICRIIAGSFSAVRELHLNHFATFTRNERRWLIPFLAGLYEYIRPLSQYDGFSGFEGSIGGFSILSTLPPTYYNQSQGKNNQQTIGNLYFDPKPFRVLGTLIMACIALAFGFVAGMYGIDAWG